MSVPSDDSYAVTLLAQFSSLCLFLLFASDSCSVPVFFCVILVCLVGRQCYVPTYHLLLAAAVQLALVFVWLQMMRCVSVSVVLRHLPLSVFVPLQVGMIALVSLLAEASCVESAAFSLCVSVACFRSALFLAVSGQVSLLAAVVACLTFRAVVRSVVVRFLCPFPHALVILV